MISQEKIDKLCNYLLGSCKSFSQGCRDMEINEEDLTFDDYAEIDNWIFCCDNCGYWCDSGERNYSSVHSADVCDDCYESN